MTRSDTHESMTPQGEVRGSSDRAFGLLFAVVFALMPLVAWWRRGTLPLWPFAVAALFLLLAAVRPVLLAPLNRLWTRFGMLLARVTNPLIMGVLFFLVLTPMALLMRAMGKRPLRLGFDRAAASYWIDRQPPGPAPDTMPNQF